MAGGASRSGTAGAVGARLDRDWMAIGTILNLSNCPLVSMSLSQPVQVEFWSYNEPRETWIPMVLRLGLLGPRLGCDGPGG